MRKKLTIFATLLVALAFGFGLKALGWTSTDPATLEDGTYYIYNVGQDKFLHQGNSWGTRASLFPQAYACHVVKNSDGTLKVQPLDGASWLADNAFMDGDPSKTRIVDITATLVDGGYKLSDGSKALAWDGKEVNWVEGATGTNATWQILTAAELKSGLTNATAEKPLDATFMIKGPRVLRANNEWQNSWTFDNGGNYKPAVNGDGSAASYEVWNGKINTTQEVSLVKGAYMLTVEGFYRFSGKPEAIAAHNDGTEELNAFLVAGEAKKALMSICDGKGITDLNNIVNDQEAAGKQLLAGNYHNALYFRVENDGPVTIGIKKEKEVGNDWTIFNCFTLTYYGPEATVEEISKPVDMTALKAACEAARAKLGFEAGEYAPYNNVASMEALIAAEAAAAEAYFGVAGQAEVDAKTAAVNALTWTANETRVDAVYNGDFLNSTNSSYADGWRATAGDVTMGGGTNPRAFVLKEGDNNYEQLAALQSNPDENGYRAALFIRYDGNGGTQYVYGGGTNTSRWSAVPTAYCMPLKAGVRYNFSADIAAWGSGAVGKTVKLYVVDADSKEVGEMSVKTESDASKVGGTAKHVAFEFIPTVDGNCEIWIQNPGSAKGPNYLVSNVSVKRGEQDQTITWEQDFTGIAEGSTVELTATASSELAVVYEFEDADAAAEIATLEGNKLTFKTEGTVVVKATQPGLEGEWKAAEPVSKAITAGPCITKLADLATVDTEKPFYVGCELTVVYMSEGGDDEFSFSSGWVYDGEGFAKLSVAKTEGLVPGAIIAAGWEANYFVDPGVLVPTSDAPLAFVADRTGEVPAPVEALSADLAANTYVRVVAALTKNEDGTYTATTDDGKVITLQNELGLEIDADEFDKFDILGFVYKLEIPTPPAEEDEDDTPAQARAEAENEPAAAEPILTIIPVKAVEYVPLVEVPADGYYWIKNTETEQYLIHNGYWGTLTTLGEYGIPVKVATVDGVTTMAYADYSGAHDNFFLFKDGANNAENEQWIYSDNMMNGDNNSHLWNLVPATPTSLYIQNVHNKAYMFAKHGEGADFAATSVAKPDSCLWEFVPAAGVAEFLAAKRDAQVAALAKKAGVDSIGEAGLEAKFAHKIDVTSEIKLPAQRGEAFQPAGGEGDKLDNSKEVMNFSIVVPKAGLYKIVVPAMWRNGKNEVTEILANADIDYANTIIYTDDFTGVVVGQSIGAPREKYDGAVGLKIKGDSVYVPNSEDSFEAAAKAGHYGNAVYAYAAQDGDTITIKAKASMGAHLDGLQWFVQNAPLTKVYLLSQEGYVVKTKQTITWEQDFSAIELNKEFELNATASSFLPVTYALKEANDNVTLAGNKLTFKAACTVVVVASQDGDDLYLAAEPVEKEIKVEAAGIEGISVDDTDALYFNLQGVQVKAPQAGQTYIVVKNGRAFKAIVK